MKRFAIKFSVFLAINLAFVLVLYITNDNSNSNLLAIPQDANYSFIILGTSHARQFSIGERQRLTEEAVGANFLNISKTGGGILPEKAYLSYFFQRHNSIKNVVYFIDPFVFYSPKWNEEMTFDNEPFRIAFLSALIEDHFSENTIHGYGSSFLHWFLSARFEPRRDTASILRKKVDLSNLKEALNYENRNFYPDGLDMPSFNKYASYLKKVIDMSTSHDAHVIFVILPNLWEVDPGKQIVKNLLMSYQKNGGVEWYDFSDSLKNPEFYSDTSHLNTDGVVYFSTHFLRKIIFPAAPSTVSRIAPSTGN